MQAQPSFAPIDFGTNDVQIMIGTFDDFTFDDVIQVLGLSRQCLRLLVRRGALKVVGAMPGTASPQNGRHADIEGTAVDIDPPPR